MVKVADINSSEDFSQTLDRVMNTGQPFVTPAIPLDRVNEYVKQPTINLKEFDTWHEQLVSGMASATQNPMGDVVAENAMRVINWLPQASLNMIAGGLFYAGDNLSDLLRPGGVGRALSDIPNALNNLPLKIQALLFRYRAKCLSWINYAPEYV